MGKDFHAEVVRAVSGEQTFSHEVEVVSEETTSSEIDHIDGLRRREGPPPRQLPLRFGNRTATRPGILHDARNKSRF